MLSNAVLGVAGEGGKGKSCLSLSFLWSCSSLQQGSLGQVMLSGPVRWQAKIVSCTYLLKTVKAICLKLGFAESTSKWLQGVNRTWSNLSLSKFPPAPLYSP